MEELFNEQVSGIMLHLMFLKGSFLSLLFLGTCLLLDLHKALSYLNA